MSNKIFKSPLSQAEELEKGTIYRRKKDGHKFIKYPEDKSLFSTTDHSGKSDVHFVKDEDLEEDYEYGDIDEDYERSYGPVDTREKYQSYLKWKKEGN